MLILLMIAIGILIFAIRYFQKAPDRMVMEKYDYTEITVNDHEDIQVVEGTHKIPDSFQKVAENDQLILYLEEETIAIAITYKANGYTWFSYDPLVDMEEKKITKEMSDYMKSGISVITYDKFTPGRRTVLDQQVEKTYVMGENGFTVTIDFMEPQIKLDLVVEIQGGDLITSIPREHIKEYNEELWTPGNDDVSINEIIMYPFLGASTGAEKGYLVIPDGSGATIKLDEVPKYPTGYVAPVYGKDLGYANTIEPNFRGISVKALEHVVLPLYGIIHEENETGVLVIAEKGASYATYNYVSKNVSTDYYQSYFTYNYRTTYSQFQSRIDENQHVLGFQKEPNKFDLVQRYVFLDKERANYVGVAKGYRNLLMKQSGFAKKEKQKFSQIPMKIDFINNEAQIGTFSPEDVVATTYNQAKGIVGDLIEKGYNNLNVTFKSFVLDKMAYGFDIHRNLGGKKDFLEALTYFEENQIPFNYYMNYARTNHDKTKYTASKMSRQYLKVLNQKYMFFNYLNKPKYFIDFAKRDIEALDKVGVDALAFDGFSGSLFTHYDKGTIGYSHEGMAYIENMLTYLREHHIETSIYSPDAYLYPYLKDYYEAPMYSSNLMFTDKTIPLVSLVMSGNVDLYSSYMNFSSNDQDTVLRLIEFGIYPSFVLTGESTYEIKYSNSSNVYVSEMQYLKERLDAYYRQANAALSQVMDSEMVGHQYIGTNVVMVTYSNNKQIIINYNDSDYNYKNITIKGKGFVVI